MHPNRLGNQKSSPVVASINPFISQQEKWEEEAEISAKKNYSKWSNEDKKMYWLSLLLIADENPLFKLSWENWKIDRCFKKMEAFFKGRKTNTQIKSFDQRMKKEFMKNRNIDLMDAIVEALNKLGLTPEESILLNNLTDRSNILGLDEIASHLELKVIPECKKDLKEIEEIYKQFLEIENQ